MDTQPMTEQEKKLWQCSNVIALQAMISIPETHEAISDDLITPAQIAESTANWATYMLPEAKKRGRYEAH